jgi:hypothetical protein
MVQHEENLSNVSALQAVQLVTVEIWQYVRIIIMFL